MIFSLWCFAGFDQSWCTIYHMWLGLHLFYQEFPFQGIITKWCKLLQKISLPVSQEQASKQLDSSFLFSYFLILSSFSGSNLSKISCTFHFGQMFIGFLTSTFDLLLKFGPAISVYHGKGCQGFFWLDIKRFTIPSYEST